MPPQVVHYYVARLKGASAGSDQGTTLQDINELLTCLMLAPLMPMLHSHQTNLMDTDIIAPLRGAFVHSLVKAHLLSTRAYNTFLILRQQLLHCPPSIPNLKHLRHRPQNHIHRAGRHFSSQKPMIKWTLIRTSHIMMTTISCPRDQTNHVAMVHICLPAAQALLVAVPLTHLQLTAVHRTASSDRITLKSTVRLFKCVLRHIITH